METPKLTELSLVWSVLLEGNGAQNGHQALYI